MALRILKGLGLIIVFVGLTALFSVVLRPLALDGGQTGNMPAPVVESPAHATANPAANPAERQEAQPGGPKVAILVTELGTDAAFAAAAIEKLPPVFGLAFLPAGESSRLLAKRARLYGHEVWVGLPMQPRGWPKVSPGPNTLLLADPAGANAQRAEWVLGQVDRPVGVYTMMGSAFTADAAAMAPVADVVRQHGVVLLDARSVGNSVAARVVTEAGGRALTNDMFIDNDPNPAAIAAALDRLAARAQMHGQAVGIARALPATLQQLPQWAEQLDNTGVTLVPPSRLAP